MSNASTGRREWGTRSVLMLRAKPRWALVYARMSSLVADGGMVYMATIPLLHPQPMRQMHILVVH